MTFDELFQMLTLENQMKVAAQMDFLIGSQADRKPTLSDTETNLWYNMLMALPPDRRKAILEKFST